MSEIASYLGSCAIEARSTMKALRPKIVNRRVSGASTGGKHRSFECRDRKLPVSLTPGK